MSLIWKKNKKKNKKLIYNEEFNTASTNDKNCDTNTISTFEKERLTKIKKVSFGTIEIIEVESYKKYNQLRILSFESIESNCLRAYDYCQCINF